MTPMILFTLTARSVHRATRKDPGKLGVWVVLAGGVESAEERWRAACPQAGEWEVEKVEARGDVVVRLF